MFGAMGNHQHRLGGSEDTDQGSVFGHQHITTAHRCAPGQEDTQHAPGGIAAFEAAFLASVPVQFDGGCALEQHRRQALATSHPFVDSEHRGFRDQNRK